MDDKRDILEHQDKQDKLVENLLKAKKWLNIILEFPKEDSWFQAVRAKECIMNCLCEIEEVKADR